jgi:hypothetical protein
MNYDELKQQVYKLSEINQRLLFYHIIAWFEASPKNKEFIRALDSLLKSEFSEGVKNGTNT